MTNYYMFRGDLWTINFNYECTACITSQTNDELTVKGTFRTTGDMVGLYWNSEDLITHSKIKYNTRYDYSDVVLEFDVEYGNNIVHLNAVYPPDYAPSLAVHDLDGTTYFVPFHNYTSNGIHYRIPFNNLISQSHTKNGVLTVEEETVDPTTIKHILIPLIPAGYGEANYIITENKEFSFKMKNITVTNGTLNQEEDPILDNPYHICEGYDDCYNFTPRRLTTEMYKLGFKNWIDIYIGASHFYEKKGTAGVNARPENPKVNYEAMQVFSEVGLTLAFRTWWKDVLKWLKYRNTPNVTCSISLENLQAPPAWRQCLLQKTNEEITPVYAKTGWTPGTYFYSLCNDDVKDWITLVAEECLDLMVDEGLQPILQWGEPWWWWQEFYPESVSNDPDVEETTFVKFPNQPPAFYDEATKAKFLEEMEYELPEYLSSQDNYSMDVINWLKNQLVEFNDFMKGIVKSYDNGLYTVLYFPPSVLDRKRVPPMMQKVNYPEEAWKADNLDFIQLEDYDWVIEESIQHQQIYTFAQRYFGYELKNIHYFAGYVQWHKNASREWPLVIKAMEDAYFKGIPHIYAWSGTQIRRDNIILHAPTVPDPPAVYPMNSVTNNTYLNIIVMDEFENVITWLNPDLLEITETNKKVTCRKISLKYPLDKAPSKNDKEWYMQGNKIFIPSTLGIDNCLYVINGEYELDYWKENKVSLEAEEVLTELNYKHIALFDDTIQVTKDKLTAWFGDYYTIRNIDKLDTGKTTINPTGVMSLMNLLRLIEEKTERVFITEYVIQDDKVLKYLHLKEEKNIRKVSNTEVLDLNFNLENISFSQDESNTFTAMAPVLSSNNTSTGSVSSVAGDSRTGVTATTQTDTKKIYERWLNLDVVAGEYIPMICEKEADGTVKYTDYWYAPFTKEKGELEITVPYETESNYKYVKPANASPRAKCGSVSTSETNAYAIYNVLANSLLGKLNPKLEVEISVKDIQKILKTKNQGYSLYETMYIRAPRFDYYIPCVITETKKDPHRAGNNTIKVESDITSLHDKKASHITTNDSITETTDNYSRISGVLATEEGNLDNQLVSVSIRLNEADKENTPLTTQEVNILNPVDRFIYVLKTDLVEIFKQIENNIINPDESLKEFYNITSVTLERYKIPWVWFTSLFYTYKTGTVGNSLVIHYYPDYNSRFNNTEAGYWLSYYYEYFNTHSGDLAFVITDGVLNKAINI